MARWLRLLHILALGALAALTGCQPPVIVGMYGPPPVEYDPTVDLSDLTYQPASPIRVGDVLTVTASLNKPVQPRDGSILVEFGSEAVPLSGYGVPSIAFWLNDQGYSGDAVAGDGIWTSELEWLPEFGPQQDLPVSAHLQWADGHYTESAGAPSLTILPAVE